MFARRNRECGTRAVRICEERFDVRRVLWPFVRRSTMKYGARNQLEATVTEVKKGTVMCQVKVKVPADSMMCSVMTVESLTDLGIKEGDKVQVVAKAVNVLLAKE
jgi:molybdopterin-binding protein